MNLLLAQNTNMKTAISTRASAIALALSLTSLVMPVSALAAAPNWDVSGSYVIAFDYLGTPYAHDLALVQDEDGDLTGNGGHPAGGAHAYAWTLDAGSVVDGDTIHLNTHYTLGAACDMTIDGVIAPNGTMTGTWTDNCDGTRNGTWASTSGEAEPIVEEPTPTTPVNKDGCKKDGWKSFTNPSFKNQGQCVAFVNHQ